MSMASATCGSLTIMLCANPAGRATGLTGSPPETVQAKDDDSGVNSNPCPPSPTDETNEVNCGRGAVDTSSEQAVNKSAALPATMSRPACCVMCMNFLGKEWSGKFSGDRHGKGTVASRLGIRSCGDHVTSLVTRNSNSLLRVSSPRTTILAKENTINRARIADVINLR